MQRVIAAAVLASLIFGGWQFLQKYQFKGLENVRVEPRGGGQDAGDSASFPVAEYGGTIKIASFNIQVFGRSKIAQPAVMQVLCDVARRFDVIAIQEVRAREDDILPRFVAQLNQGNSKRSEEHTSELQSRLHLVCRLLLEKKKKKRSKQLLSYSYNHI